MVTRCPALDAIYLTFPACEAFPIPLEPQLERAPSRWSGAGETEGFLGDVPGFNSRPRV